MRSCAGETDDPTTLSRRAVAQYAEYFATLRALVWNPLLVVSSQPNIGRTAVCSPLPISNSDLSEAPIRYIFGSHVGSITSRGSVLSVLAPPEGRRAK